MYSQEYPDTANDKILYVHCGWDHPETGLGAALHLWCWDSRWAGYLTNHSLLGGTGRIALVSSRWLNSAKNPVWRWAHLRLAYNFGHVLGHNILERLTVPFIKHLHCRNAMAITICMTGACLLGHCLGQGGVLPPDAGTGWSCRWPSCTLLHLWWNHHVRLRWSPRWHGLWGFPNIAPFWTTRLMRPCKVPSNATRGPFPPWFL